MFCCVRLFATQETAACQASLSFTISWNLLKFLFIESMMPSNHLIHCHPLLLWLSIFHSIRVFSNESALCTRWPKYWSFNFSINPSNEYSGLISFWIDWFDLPVVQGIDSQESCAAPQFESISSLVLAFFMVQLLYQYMSTGKTIALTVWTFVSKEMSLLFNMLSRFVIAFLPKSKHLLISQEYYIVKIF